MSFKLEIYDDFTERCDKCGEIDKKRPMLVIHSNCKETGKVQTWVHLDEFIHSLDIVQRKRDKAYISANLRSKG